MFLFFVFFYYNFPMAKKEKKRHSISSKIILWTAVTITSLLVVMGICLYYRISGIDEAQYSKLTRKNLALTDAAINQYFHGAERISNGEVKDFHGFKDFLSGILQADSAEVHEFILVVDKSGTVLVNQFDSYSEFKSLSSLEISGSMNEMSTGVSDINNSMQNINEQSRQNMNSIEKVTGEINKFKV